MVEDMCQLLLPKILINLIKIENTTKKEEKVDFNIYFNFSDRMRLNLHSYKIKHTVTF